MAALADSEAQALLHGDRVDEVALDGDVVTRHSHLGALGELDRTGNVGGTEVELRTITIEERGVTAALLLGQNVDLAGELGVRGNRTGLAENLAALDVLALDAAEQQTDVVASLAEVHGLTEHLDTGNDGVLGILDADDLDGLVELELTALDTAGQPFRTDPEYLSQFDRLMDVTSLVILDLKEIDPEKHRQLTGKDNANILAMAQHISDRGIPLWIRHVLVPGLTDDEEGLRRTAAFISSLKTVERVEVLPYHTLGLFKWQKLGIPYPLPDAVPPTAEQIRRAEELLTLSVKA